MASFIPGFAYDIFISYRHKDNLPSLGYGSHANDGWVTEFVAKLRKELEATFKEDVSIYFDENPHDGLLGTHDVDKSLEGKLKALIFIPVISQTYCDDKSFEWKHEFLAFTRISASDKIGTYVNLSNGNVASRILPVKIHEIDAEDKQMLENELGGVLRSVDFIYKSAGVNRPLRPNEEHPDENIHQTIYRDQINKLANAVKEIISALQHSVNATEPQIPLTTPDEFQADRKQDSKSTKTRKQPKKISALFLGPVSSLNTRRSLTSVILFSFGPAFLLSLITGVVAWNFRPAAVENPTGVIRTSILLPKDKPLEFVGNATLGIGRKSLTISRDGTKVAYLGRQGETTKLMVRSLDEFGVYEIPNTEGAFNPVFSPDGKYLVFFQRNYVKLLTLQNNAVSVLAQEPELCDASWGNGGELFFSSHEGRKLFRYFQKLELIADNKDSTRGVLNFKFIHRIPETDYLLASYQFVRLLNLKTMESSTLSLDGTVARYVSTGHIIFMKGSSLMAVRFDIQRQKVTSEEVEILRGIRSEADGAGQFDFSSDGKLVFVEGANARKAHFVLYDHKQDTVEPLNFPSQEYSQFSVSPDGNRIAVSELHLSRNIYLYELKTRKITRITHEGSCGGGGLASGWKANILQL